MINIDFGFLHDFLNHIPNFSHIQIGLFLLIIALVYFIEHLSYYNMLVYGAVSNIPGMPSAGSATAPQPSQPPHHRHRAKRRRFK